jgi:hypothetical protein
MSWIKTVDDALAEARDADDPCCVHCTQAALTVLADEVDRLRDLGEARSQSEYRGGRIYRRTLYVHATEWIPEETE